MNYRIELRHKDTIRIGDVIECKDGVLRTVCRKDITGTTLGNSFMGTCLFGDSYMLGHEPVRLAVIEHAQVRR